MKKIKILGIDPGHINIGFAVLELDEEYNMNLLFIQDISLSKNPQKYKSLFNITRDIIETYEPNQIIIEKTLVRNNNNISLLLSQSRGILMLCTEIYNMETFEVTNNKLKKFFCNKGNATKLEINHRVKHIFQKEFSSNGNDALMMAYYGCKVLYPNNSTG